MSSLTPQQGAVEQRDNSSRIAFDSENAQDGLAQLVLTVIELVRELVERQAMRRVESGSLSDEEVERLGEALWELESKMEELQEYFGLTKDDLNIDLGPLGNLL
ncbi:gas vesicle protein K [Alkalicoccus urumqiensis]|uniref:Gas vesicle protein K n=1 Tax=Alkalicoccus urumqiensis TaxID=1548213 RepID=A0A2P6MIS8_ALKUR|nr:gas vesicle protein K [Alkalicoccus urumqiensis]PRO66180.1 gas vesicle protein K [Alkalicoccus urumqiensis]